MAGREVAAYHYVDEQGFPLYDVVRFDPKDFRQRHRENGGWVWNLKGVDRVPYRLPAVLEAVAARRPVWICEGEEDVHALERLGVVATTNPGGTGNTKLWRDFAHWFEGAEVVIVADRDEPGMRHAREVRTALAGVALTVCIVQATSGKDASDHIGAGLGLADFVEVDAEQPAPTPEPDPSKYAVVWDESGKTPKLKLPRLPDLGDITGLCGWLTAVFALDPLHPVTGSRHRGNRGPTGSVEIHRADAEAIVFDPASHLNSGAKITDTLTWHALPFDSEPHAFTNEHARHILRVVRVLCGSSEGLSIEQQVAGIIGTFQSGAVAVTGQSTYGETVRRYEAVAALQRQLDGVTGRPVGPPRYLVDDDTGELVIRVSDLAAAARAHTGSSLRHGWLDAQMEVIGWQRVTLEGFALPGRDGREGPHARCDAYRGHPPTFPESGGHV